MRIVPGATSDIGKVREGNEDSYLALDPLFAVADGMGGHRGGEVASKLALEILENQFRRRQGALAEHVQEANLAVFERSQLDRRVAGMGTTLTVAVMEDERVRLAHVGDSRAYLYRDGELRLLTEDHTLVQRMVDEGEITAGEAETHPYRSVLTRALGVEQSVAVDEGSLEVQDGDRLLLCTDGLTGMVTDEQIRAILQDVGDPQEAADRLVRAANRAGGIDNITAVVLDFEAGEKDDEAGTQGQGVAEPAASAISGAQGPRGLRSRGIRPARLAVSVGMPLAIFIVVLVGLRLYLDRQWYVGVQNGHVTEFRGIPSEVAGFELHHPVVVTTIPAVDAERLAVYAHLDEGIPATGREDADSIVEQIRTDLGTSRTGVP